MTDQFALTDDQLAIQDMAQKFTADRITPFAAEWDEQHHYPVDVWKAAGELGFGDTDQYGMEGLKFWTKVKKITARWPDGGGDGSNAFVIPTMG